MAVRVRDAHIVCLGVARLVRRQDAFAREAVDRGERRGGNQAGISQRQEIIVIVDQIELPRAPKGMCEVQSLPIPWRPFRPSLRRERRLRR